MGKTDDKVKNILAGIKSNKKSETVDIPIVNSSENVLVKKSESEVPRGRPKSGRIWKNTKQRLVFNEFSAFTLFLNFIIVTKNMYVTLYEM